MSNTTEIMNSNVINTTVGELIHAISEAAREATVREEDLPHVTHMILEDLLERRKD